MLSWSGGPSWNGIASREIQVRNLLGVTGIQMEFNGIAKHSSIQLLGAAAARARKRTRLAPSVCAQAHSSRRSAREQAVSVSFSCLSRPVVGALISGHVNSPWMQPRVIHVNVELVRGPVSVAPPLPSNDLLRSLGIQAGLCPLNIATLSCGGGPSQNGKATREIYGRSLLKVKGI